jgi:hypothetical protein
MGGSAVRWLYGSAAHAVLCYTDAGEMSLLFDDPEGLFDGTRSPGQTLVLGSWFVAGDRMHHAPADKWPVSHVEKSYAIGWSGRMLTLTGAFLYDDPREDITLRWWRSHSHW